VLRKSLLSDSSSEVLRTTDGVVREALLKSLSREEAILFVLKQKPKWTFELASQVVDYTLQNLAKEK